MSSCLLNQETHRTHLVQSAQLCLVVWRTHAAENALSLDEDLRNIHDEASSISQSEAPFHPPVDDLSVLFIVTGASEVPRTENFSLLLDDQVIVGDDPVLLHHSELLNLVLVFVVGDGSCSGSINYQNGVYLSSQGFSNQLLVCNFPDGENASDREISVHNGASIERIVCNDISFPLFPFPCRVEVGPLLAGKELDLRVFLEVLLNDEVTFNILMELLITELVDRF